MDNTNTKTAFSIDNFFKHSSLAKAIFPESEKNFRSKRLRYTLRLCFLFPKLSNEIESFFSANKLRQTIFSHNGFKGKIYRQQIRNCFYNKSKPSHRLHFLKSHFSILESTHRENIIHDFYTAKTEPIIFQEGDNKLSFQIIYTHDIVREGLLWLRIALNDEVLYKITFWFCEHGNQNVMCVGALQGGKATLEVNRSFTKLFWGLRPQNMAMSVLRWYAQTIGIEKLYTFPIDKLWSDRIVDKENIAEFWLEQGARVVAGSPFIELAFEIPHKAMNEIPTRKRSMYKKRYDFLDRLRPAITEKFISYLK